MFASVRRRSESKKVLMAQVLPVPNPRRPEAEPLLATIGNTPLVRLEKTSQPYPGIEILGKAEFYNPGGSVKDRAAMNMILDGERSGKLNHQRTLLDATSGNTGIAYAMIGAVRGYKIKLVLPANASIERKRILKAYGAEMVFSDAGGRLRRGNPAVPRDLQRRPRHLFLSRPVQQPGELESALRAHGAGDHPTDRWADHALCDGHGDQRHVHGGEPASAARHAAREVLFGAALERIPRAGRIEAHADGHRAGHL